MPEETAPGMTTVNVENVEPIGFFRSFVGQGNLAGRLSLETWYGHHSPWLRIFLFITLSSFLWTLQALVGVQAIGAPILRPMSEAQLQEVRDIHRSCLLSICEVARDIPPIDCIVSADGLSAHMDSQAYDGPREVPMPHACRVAMQKTVGLEPAINLLRIRDGNEISSQSNTTDLFTIQSDSCTLEICHGAFQDRKSSFSGHDYRQATDAIPFILDKPEPGKRQQDLFERRVCTNLWSDEGREVFSVVQSVYEWVITHRFVVYIASIYIAVLLWNLGWLVWLMIRLIPTTVLLRMVLPWPKGFVGFQTVTFWSTWRALVLLCTITADREGLSSISGIMLAFILIIGALYYEDKKAALEWGFLFFILSTKSTLYSLLDAASEYIAMFDALNLIYFITFGAGMFIPGEGWWKLMTSYGLCLSYTPIQKEIKSRLSAARNTNERNKVEQYLGPIAHRVVLSNDINVYTNDTNLPEQHAKKVD